LLSESALSDIVELLALVKKPLSAYRVSKMYNMNIGKVYLEMKKLANLGIAKSQESKIDWEYLGKQAKKRTH
jgi:predicted transcriptional regulator